MLKTLALTLTLLLSFTMAACSSTSGTNAKIDQTTTNAAQTAPTDAVQRIRLPTKTSLSSNSMAPELQRIF